MTLYCRFKLLSSCLKVTLAESHAEELEQQLTKAKQKLKESEVNQLQSKTLTLQLDQAKAKVKVKFILFQGFLFVVFQ